MDFNDETMLRMTVAEFKAFKRSIQILCRMGLTYRAAIDILITARKQEMTNRERFKSCG